MYMATILLYMQGFKNKYKLNAHEKDHKEGVVTTERPPKPEKKPAKAALYISYFESLTFVKNCST